MLNKAISTIFLSASVAILALANNDPNNLLFLFASPDRWTSALRVLLAAAMVAISFREYLPNKRLRETMTAGGCLLIAIGISSLLITPITNAIYDYLKLVDAMIVAEAGVIFAYCSLSMPAKLPKSRRQKASAKKANLRRQTA